MQLTRRGRGRLGLAAFAFLTITCGSIPQGSAQVAGVDTSHTLYYEAPSYTHMLVYTPGVGARASPTPWLDVHAAWEADVVSGASVVTKYGPAYQATHPADVVSTASVRDLRNVGEGEVTFKGDASSLTAGYAYSTEHDYRSHSVHVSATADAFKHDTQLALSYARNFDSVCDRVQSQASPTRWTALETSTGCFTADPTRATHPIAIDSYEASWSQAWTPLLETQVTYTAQLVDGFQGDPYRSVVLGDNVRAEEHEPNDRARQALTVRVAYYLRPIRGAVRIALRGYSDTWDIQSGSVDAELEKTFSDAVRALVRGRVYKQSGALFWSDDYTGGGAPLGPRGQYWTGDRELSPFWSWLVGLRGVLDVQPSRGRLLGVLDSAKAIGSVTMTSFTYEEYTLGGQPVTNARAYLATITLDASF